MGPTQTISRLRTSTAEPSKALVAGQTATFTATVNVVSPGAGKPTETVAFYDGSQLLGSANVVNGKAVLVTALPFIGNNTITASYSGDSDFATSGSSGLAQTVDQDKSKMTLTSSAPPATVGQVVTFTATVSAATPGSGTPTGWVVFKDGNTVLATIELTSGQTVFSTALLGKGSHSITASYLGDADFLGIVGSLTQKVN